MADIVATGLPDFGDRQNSRFSTSKYNRRIQRRLGLKELLTHFTDSLLNFAHLYAT